MTEITKLAASVFLGSGLGGVCRFILSLYIQRRVVASAPDGLLSAFPWPTFAVNIIGCFLIGAFYAIFARFAPPPAIKALVTAGFCGGLTTFSTFTFENMTLFDSGRWSAMAAYIAASLILGFIAACAGRALIQCFCR